MLFFGSDSKDKKVLTEENSSVIKQIVSKCEPMLNPNLVLVVNNLKLSVPVTITILVEGRRCNSI